MLKKLFLATLLFTGSSSLAQDLSGTWEGVFYSDRLGKKISYSIRFFLEQEASRLWGVCEAMSVESSPGTYYPDGAQVLRCRYPVEGEVPSLLEKNSPVSLHSKIPNLSPVSTDFCENISSFLFTYDILEDSVAQLSGEWIATHRPAIGMPVSGREIWIKKISGKTPGFIEEFFPRSVRRSRDLTESDGTVKDKSDKDKKEPRLKFPLFKKKKEKEEEVIARVEKDKTAVTPDRPPDSLEVAPRKADIQETIATDSAFVRIALYDNGLVDGDIISLYLNDAKIVDKKKITARAIELELPLNPYRDNIIRLYAENTGDIPPNTALLVVRTRTATHHINLSASLQRDALVVIKVEKPDR